MYSNQQIILKSDQGDTSFDTNKIYLIGEKGSDLKPRGELQDYNEIKANCQRYKQLFVDSQFTPEIADLKIPDGVSGSLMKLQWKRPFEIVKNPQLIVEGISRFDINQGSIGDCWYLAAVADIAESSLIKFIVPDDQGFDKNNYVGCFHFRFWQYGRWIDVVVDDLLPTDSKNQLVGLHSTDSNEMWPALLEKAYAKLYGSYAKLDGGLTSEALEDLTGGLSALTMVDSTPILKDVMVKSFKSKAYMGCAVKTTKMEEVKDNGLVGQHAYSITNVVQIENPQLTLVRIRNPWGQMEWTGRFSDNSEEWKKVPGNIRDQLLRKEEDGEFWIEFSDFQKQIYFVEFCYPNPNAYALISDKQIQWFCHIIDGAWIKNVNAGGCDNATLGKNPQYLMTVAEKSNLIVSLMQKDRRLTGDGNLAIGFGIFKVGSSINRRLTNEEIIHSQCVKIVNDTMRQVTHFDAVPSGTYCIVPFTYEKNLSGKFLLRVYCTSKFELKDANMSINENQCGWREPVSQSPISVPKEIESDPIFKKIAGDDGEVDWKELQGLLNNYWLIDNKKPNFSKDQCRSLIAIFDIVFSGKLDYNEFMQLWKRIALFKKYFQSADSDNSMTISGLEFVSSLQKLKIPLNDRLISVIFARYGNENNEIEFEDYILCMCKLLNAIEGFLKNQSKLPGVAFEEWMRTVMYA